MLSGTSKLLRPEGRTGKKRKRKRHGKSEIRDGERMDIQVYFSDRTQRCHRMDIQRCWGFSSGIIKMYTM
jgi:hypothetical protein